MVYAIVFLLGVAIAAAAAHFFYFNVGKKK